MDLFDGQANPLGSWMTAGVAGRVIWPGITRPGVATRGWVTVAVGSQLGSHLGYPATPRTRPARYERPAGEGSRWAGRVPQLHSGASSWS